jgi:hypothetical protein
MRGDIMTKEEFEKALGEVVAYEIDTGEFEGPLEALKKNITTEVMELVGSVFEFSNVLDGSLGKWEEYLTLISKVSQIDMKAAEYLRYEAGKLPSFNLVGDLLSCFFWDNTPQGHEYWEDIHFKVSGKHH